MSAAGATAYRVCILLEGTGNMIRYWPEFRESYLLPLLQSLPEQGKFEVAVVVYATQSAHSLTNLERSDWSSSLSEVHSLLESVELFGGGHNDCCLSEAFSEALCLFAYPSQLGPPSSITKHCLLMSVSQAHMMPVPWLHPTSPADGSKQAGALAAFSIDMAAALHQAGISLSVFSAYPPDLPQGKPSWPSILYKLFEQAEQGPNTAEQAEQDKQQQHQQQQHARARLRQQCSVGHQPGYFALVSERWGTGLRALQVQRSKRKAAQAFDEAAVHAEGRKKGPPETIDLSNSPTAPRQAAPPAATLGLSPPIPATLTHPAQALSQIRGQAVEEMPLSQHGPHAHTAGAQGYLPQNGKIDSTVPQSAAHCAGPQSSPALSSKTPGPHAMTLSSGGGSAIDITGEDSEAGSGHTSHRASPGVTRMLPGSSPVPRSHPGHQQPQQRQPAVSPFAQYSSELPPSIVSQAMLRPHQPQPSQQLQQQQPAMPQLIPEHVAPRQAQQADRRPDQPPGAHHQPAPPSIALYQQKLLEQQQRQQQQRQQQQQLHTSTAVSSAMLQPQQPQHTQQQQAQAPAQQHQAIGSSSTGATPQHAQLLAQQGASQQMHSQPMASDQMRGRSPLRGVHQPGQQQPQLQHQAQQLQDRLQQATQAVTGSAPTVPAAVALSKAAATVATTQAREVRQLQDLQHQLRMRQGLVQAEWQGQGQGQSQAQGQGSGPLQAASAGQDQGQSQGQLSGQGARHGFPGGGALATSQGVSPVRPPTMATQGSAQLQGQSQPWQAQAPKPSPPATPPHAAQQLGGVQQVIWRGWVIAASSVIKQSQPGRLVSGAMLVSPAAWPAGLEQGWPQQLIVSRLMPVADMKTMLGQGVLEQSPRVFVQVQSVGEHGKEFVKSMLLEKLIGVVQLPVSGKFLGLVVLPAPSSTVKGQLSPRLHGFVLPLPRSKHSNSAQQSQTQPSELH